MCDPVSLMMGASTAVGAIGTVYSANANASAAAANAAIQRENALRSEEAAKDAIRRGQMEEDRLRREGAQVIGAQEAGFAAGGLDLGYGSPLDTIISTAASIELDAMTIRENSRREANDLELQAYNQRAGAAVGVATAKANVVGGTIGGISSVLNGGASIYKYRAQNL